MTQAINDGFNAQQSIALLPRNDVLNRWGNVVASFLEIPGLVGLWPMSSVQRSTGNAYDVSGQGRTLTYNGNPVYDYENLTPFLSLDGAGDYLSRTDETDLDILGTETIFASNKRGLTLGGWVRFDATGSGESIISKLGASTSFSYDLIKNSGDSLSAIVSGDGTTITSSPSANTISANQWYFAVGRFDPSTTLSTFSNTGTDNALVEAQNTTSIPASIFSSTSNLNVGRRDNNTLLMTGDVSIIFLSANYVSDAIIFGLYEQSKVLYGY